MATYKNQDGTSASDVLIYDQGGEGIVYHSYAGHDKVNIQGGSITIINESGNDTFTVTGGSGHHITGASTVDTLIINGGNCVEGTLGSGRDVVNITKSNGRKTGGALSQIRGGEWTDTFTTEADAQYYQLYGEDGNDIFIVNGGYGIFCWGGAASDTFTVTGGSNIRLRGGDSADEYNIYADKVDIQLGYGNDIVNVYSGNSQAIKANLGVNQINLWGGKSHTITSDIDQAASQKAGREVGYGVDNVLIDGADMVTANTGDGKDVFTVKGGTGHKIHTEGWGDTIYITGNVSNSLFDAGGSNDAYIVDWDQLGAGNVIDQTTASATDKDSLSITDRRASEFSFAIQGSSLIVTEPSTSKKLEIRGWKNGLNSISFSDRTLSGDEFFKQLIIDDGKDHGEVKLGTAARGEISGYTVLLENGNAGAVSAAYDTKDPSVGTSGIRVTADGNKVVVDAEGKVTINKTAGLTGDVKTAYVVNGTASNNAAILKGGSVEGNITAAYVENGTAVGNTVTITDGTAKNAYGAQGTSATVKDNQVIMQGGSVNTLYGGYSESNSSTGNKVNMESGVVDKIYGGYAKTGAVSDNSIELSGDALVKGNAYINFSESGNTGAGTATISEAAQIKGTLYGRGGVDTITVNGGSVNVIDAQADNDVIAINGGQVERILGGVGDEVVTITGGAVNLVDGQSGDDRIVVDGGSVNQISGGVGNDTVIVSGGQIEKIAGGSGDDTIELSGGRVGIIEGGSGKDSITIDWDKLEQDLVLDQTSAGLTDKDVIKIDNAVSEDFRFNVVDGTLIMTYIDGRILEIRGWTKGTDSVTFADKTMTGEDFIKKLFIDDGAEHGQVLHGFKEQGNLEEYSVYLIDGSTTGIIGTKTNSGSAINNNIIVTGGNVNGEGSIIAGLTANGNATDNIVSITGGSVALSGNQGYVVGGQASGGKAENNQVELALGSYEAVYGGWSDTSTASGNTVTVDGESIIHKELVGGLTDSGRAENNTLILQDKALVQGDVYINKVAEGGSGTTGDGAATLKDEAEITGVLYGGDGADNIEVQGGTVGGISTGAGNDTITVSGGSIENINTGAGTNSVSITGGSVAAINGGTGVDTITITGGSVNSIITGDGEDVITYTGGEVSLIEGGNGKDTITVDWSVLDNTKTLVVDQTSAGAKDRDVLTIENAISDSFSFSLKEGIFTMIDDEGKKLEIHGWDNGMNSITFADKTLSGDDFFPVMDKELVISDGEEHGEVRFAETLLAEKSGYTVKLLDGSVNKLYTVYDLNNPEDYDELDVVVANDNSIVLGGKGEVIGAGLEQGSAAVAHIVNGSATNNSFTVNGGQVEGTATAVEILQGTATANTVTINSGNLTAVAGAIGAGATVGDNLVKQLGGQVDTVYGGKTVGGTATGNQVNITGGVANTVYGGYSNSGSLENNSVLLEGNAVVNGSVYTNYTESGTAGTGAVTVQGEAQVKGTIFGAAGIDTITVKSGSVKAIDGQGGADIVTVIGGHVEELNGGAGADTIAINGGEVGQLDGGADNDTITVEAGQVNLLAGGVGADTILVKGGKILQLEGGAGTDTITISGGEVGSLAGGEGNDIINLKGGTVEKVQGGLGKDTITIDWLGCNDKLVIDQTTAGSSDGDIIKLDNVAAEAFVFDLEGEVLTLTDGDGKQLFIKGWGKGTNSLTFADKTMTTEEMFAQLIIQDGKAHDTIKLAKGEQGELSGHTVIIDNGSVKDTYAAYDTSTSGESGSAGRLEATANEVIVNAQGQVVAAPEEGLPGDIMAAFVVNGTASDNKATLNGGSVTGTLVAASIEQGTASDNTTTINSGSAGAAYGAKSTQAELKNNSLVMSGGELEEVYGGSSEQGQVTGNQVELTGGTVENVYGGASATGEVAENSVALAGTAVINGNVYANYTETGTAGAGEVTVAGEAQVKGSIIGSAGVDTVTISGGTVNKLESGVGADILNIQGGQVKLVDGGAGDDEITVTAGTANNISGGNGDDAIIIRGGQVELLQGGTGADSIVLEGGVVTQLEGGADNDTITLSGGRVTTVSGGTGNDTINLSGAEIGKVEAGSGTDTIVVDWDKLVNTVVLDQTTAGAKDEDIIRILNGNSYDFVFSKVGDTMVVVDDEGKHRLEIKGWGQGTDSLTFDDRTMSGEDFFPTENKKLVILDGQDHGLIKWATTGQGERFGYIVKLADGSADSAYAVYDTNTSGANIVTARGNTMLIGDKGSVAQEAVAAYVYQGTATGNVASVEGGSVGALYGAKGQAAEVFDNSAMMKDGTAVNVYGGASQSGSVHDNSVSLKGEAVVTGDVYANYTVSGTTGDGTVIVDGNAQVRGTVYGDTGVDTVTIKGGFVNNIDTKTGDDLVTVSGGEVKKIVLSGGADTVELSGGTVEEIALQSDTSLIKVSGGTLGNLEVTSHQTSVQIADGKVEKLTAGSINIENNVLSLGNKASTVELLGGSIEELYGSGNMKVLNSALEETILHAGAAAEQLTIENSTLGGLSVGAGNDTINVSKNSQVGYIELVAGNNTVNVNSSQVLGIKGGTGTDTVKVTSSTVAITEGDIDNVTLEGNNNQVDINGAIVSNLRGGTGTDIVNLTNANVTLYKDYGAGTLEQVNFVAGDNTLVVTGSNVIEALKGGDGYDKVEISGGTITLTEGTIEDVEVTKACTVNVAGAEVAQIDLEDGTGYKTLNINVNSGYVGYIDASNSRATINANGGVIDIVEGDEVRRSSYGNTVNVDNVQISQGQGTINKLVGRKTVNISGGSVQNVYGSDADNTITVSGAKVKTLGTGEGQDTVTITSSEIETLIISGDMSTVEIGSTSQWGQEDVNKIGKLIMEGGSNTVNVNNNSSTISEIIGNGTRDVVTVGCGEVKITGGVVEVLRIKGSSGSQPAHIILDGGSIGMLSASGSGGKAPIIDIIKGSVGGISIAYANSETVNGGSMTFANADSLGEVRAGYSSGENATANSMASGNTVTLNDCRLIEAIYAGCVENVSGLVTTSAGSNVVNVTGSTTIKKIYAAYIDAAFTGVEANGPMSYANYNKVYINDTSSILKVDYICTAYGKDMGFAPAKAETSQSYSHMSYNIVDISTKYAELGVVYAAYSDNSPGRLTLNEIKLKGSKEGSLTIDKIYSGFATNFGNVGSTWMTGNENKVTASDITAVNEIYAGAADIGANAMLNIGTYTDLGRVGKVYAGYADCAEAQYNTLNITNANSIEELYGGYNTCVNIGITYKNTVKLNNCSSLGKLIAGYTDANCTFGAYENKIFVTDSTIEEVHVSFNASTSSAVGHSSSTSGIGASNGGCENNLVALLGNSVVTGDVYINYASSVGNAEKNRLFVGGNSQIQGNIRGNEKTDIFKLAGGIVNNVSVGGGDDLVRMSGGTAVKLDGSLGDDKLLVTGGSLQQLLGGYGKDIIVVDYSDTGAGPIGVAEVDAGADDDIVLVKGSYAGINNTILLGAGADLLKLMGNNSNGVYGGAGDDVIVVSGNSNLIKGEAGNDIIKVSQGSGNRVWVGSGNDTVVLAKNGVITDLEISYSSGDKVATVLLENTGLEEMDCQSTAEGCTISWDSNSASVLGDATHSTIIYCQDGFITYDATEAAYVKSSSATYAGDALEKLTAAESSFTTASYAISSFDGIYFLESELKVTGNA